MTRAVRRCVLAGCISGAAMMTVDASAADAFVQGCPTWLSWACPENANSNRRTRKAEIKSVRRHNQVPETTGATANKVKQTQGSNPARPARNGERLPMNDQEKEALFEQFLEWKKGLGQDTGTIR
jgi:hypothetical protein